MEIYKTPLDRCIQVINYSDSVAFETTYYGIDELVIDGEKSTPFYYDDIGYSITDINDDGIMELLLINSSYEYNPHGTEIYALFTTDGKEAIPLIEGYSRDRYFLLKNGTFYNEGSSGASANSCGSCILSKDKPELEWDFFVFSEEDLEGNVHFYYNRSGEWDPNGSIEITSDLFGDYWIDSSIVNSTLKKLDFNTISDYLDIYLKTTGNSESTRVSYTILDLEPYTDMGEYFTISTYIGGFPVGDPPKYEFIVDQDTVFDQSCELGYFENAEPGESPLHWLQKTYAYYSTNPDYFGSALYGVFDVSVTGNHIDAFYGIYWWD